MGCERLGAQRLRRAHPEGPHGPHEYRNCLWDGGDHVGYDLVLLCSRFLGMQMATYIVAHLLGPLD